MMPLFYVNTKITGDASGQVIAESAEMAMDMFNQGEVEMEITDWDVNVDQSRGGYIEVEASNQIVLDDPFAEATPNE